MTLEQIKSDIATVLKSGKKMTAKQIADTCYPQLSGRDHPSRHPYTAQITIAIKRMRGIKHLKTNPKQYQNY